MDLSLFALDALVVLAIYVIVNLVVKPVAEIWLKPEMPAHDPAIRALAVGLGVAGVFLDHGLPPTSSGSAWIGLVVSGILSGLSSVGLYHAAAPALRAGATPLLPLQGWTTSAAARIVDPQSPTPPPAPRPSPVPTPPSAPSGTVTANVTGATFGLGASDWATRTGATGGVAPVVPPSPTPPPDPPRG